MSDQVQQSRFIYIASCPFCKAHRNMVFDNYASKYTCDDCNGIRDAEFRAQCEKCSMDYCPICVQVPTTPACAPDNHTLVNAIDRSEAPCFGCGTPCSAKEDPAHVACERCGVRYCKVGNPKDGRSGSFAGIGKTKSSARGPQKCRQAAPVAATAPVSAPTPTQPSSSSSPTNPPLISFNFFNGPPAKHPVLAVPGISLLSSLDSLAIIPSKDFLSFQSRSAPTRLVFLVGVDGNNKFAAVPGDADAGRVAEMCGGKGEVVQVYVKVVDAHKEWDGQVLDWKKILGR